MESGNEFMATLKIISKHNNLKNNYLESQNQSLKGKITTSKAIILTFFN